MLLLLGCSALETAPSWSDAIAGDSGTSTATGTDEVHPVDSAWTDPYGVFPGGSKVLVATATGTACNAYGEEAALVATAVSSGTVRFEHRGAVDGCGVYAETPVLVELDEVTRTASLLWWTGDCDAIFCSEYVATVRGFPSGIWHVEERRAGRVDVIVP